MLEGSKIAILVEEQYQDLEVWYPYFRLKEERAEPVLVGTGSADEYRGKFGYPVKVDQNIGDVSPAEFDAVIIPGGWAPDFIRRYPKAVEFIRAMDATGKVVASICHGAWILASADILRGRRITCFSAIKDDIINAGGKYVDEEVVVEGNLISSRRPEDLPVFVRRILDAVYEAREREKKR